MEVRIQRHRESSLPSLEQKFDPFPGSSPISTEKGQSVGRQDYRKIKVLIDPRCLTKGLVAAKMQGSKLHKS